MNPIILIQCRLKSKRLPFKALRPLYGVPMIVRLVERLKHLGIPIRVCTSTDNQDLLLCSMLDSNHIAYMRGHPDNLAQRFLEAAGDFNPIIRVTADNPLTDPNIMLDLLAEWKPGAYCWPSVVPKGVRSEVFGTELLRDMPAEDQENMFSTYLLNSGADCNQHVYFYGSDISLTCDTHEDYARLRRIYNFWKGQPPNLEAIIEHWAEY